MITSKAYVATTRPATYLQRLCKHFRHKVPAEFNEQHGTVQFAMGVCDMHVEPEKLVVEVYADNTAALAQVKYIVGDHVERFGHHDRLTVQWQDNVEAAHAKK
ncbi:MAG: DUF2218 domain-containing protein [Anaerolineae bacterium]|nr:DUF2218 domain-containing protein [Anaerolineae bacterium]